MTQKNVSNLQLLSRRRKVDKAEVKENDEDDFQRDKDEPEERKKPPAAVEEEIKVAMNDPDQDVAEFVAAPVVPPESDSGFFASICYTLKTLFSRAAPNYRSQQGYYLNSTPNGIDAQKDEVELKEHGEDDLQLDKDELDDGRKPPTAVKREEEDETEKKNNCDDDIQRDNDEPEDSKQASAAVKEEEEDDDEVGHEYPSRGVNIFKRKHSLRSLSQKKGARSKPLRKDTRSSTSLGEVNRSPTASSDEDEFRRGTGSHIFEASDTSDFNLKNKSNKEIIWSFQFKKLQDYYENHGHCELFWTVDRFTFILNAPTNTPPLSLYHTCR
jgi:hypothetical protein